MKKRKICGWGYEGDDASPVLVEKISPYLGALYGITEKHAIQPKRTEEIRIRSPRFVLSNEFGGICTSDKLERLNHSYGKSYRDLWRAMNGLFDNPPDYVALPQSEKDIETLMAFATKNRIALIPYGGGSSVCGGIEPTDSKAYIGTISVDMRHFDKVLEVDKVSRSALMQAGIYGPAIEHALKPHGLTLRHFPQSFEFSSLGGWIATRSGGHFATLYTRIDEFVESLRMVTPSGIIDTKKLPSHGAGPSEEALICGSEGVLGIITSAWMRLQQIPQYKCSSTIGFDSFQQGVEACRILSQSGLYPSNARLIDSQEAFLNGVGDGAQSVLILGFESHNHPVNHWLDFAENIAVMCGGIKLNKDSSRADNQSGTWKKSFLQAPFLRDVLVQKGLIVETFETAMTWDRFDQFHRAIIQTAQKAISDYAEYGTITTRFTHLYPDGPASYYTVMARGRAGRQLEEWDQIKHAVSAKIVEMEGPITHHHAVGKDHRPFFEKQRSELFGRVLKASKSTLDPAGIMNPGTLIQ